MFALADVRAAEVVLRTDYAFGSVKAGWLRVWGRLNRVTAAERKAFYSWDKDTKSTSLTDQGTGEKLWFCSDTLEGFELVESGKGIDKLAWMPLTLQFDSRIIRCDCLVLMEVGEEEDTGDEVGFVKPGEKVYRRLGTGDFGRASSMIRQDKLLMRLGAYPDTQAQNGQGEELASFKRTEDGFEDFVLI